MSTINKKKIGTVASLAAGSTHNFQWNNPPWDTVLGYFAYPITPSVSGPHGAANGTVEITSVSCTHLRDNYSGDKKYVTVSVKNTGSVTIGFDLWESWIS
jgi:hypothetical protein